MSTLLLGFDGTQIWRIHGDDGKLIGLGNCSKETCSGACRDNGTDGTYVMSREWKRRFSLIIQRFWQPTSACMTCMPGSWGNVMSFAHWTIAFKTGLLTGFLAVLLTFTPASRLYAHRYGNALIVGLLTTIGDAYSHASRFHIPYVEHFATGAISGLLTLAATYLFEDRARRLRAAWARVSGKRIR